MPEQVCVPSFDEPGNWETSLSFFIWFFFSYVFFLEIAGTIFSPDHEQAGELFIPAGPAVFRLCCFPGRTAGWLIRLPFCW